MSAIIERDRLAAAPWPRGLISVKSLFFLVCFGFLDGFAMVLGWVFWFLCFFCFLNCFAMVLGWVLWVFWFFLVFSLVSTTFFHLDLYIWRCRLLPRDRHSLVAVLYKIIDANSESSSKYNFRSCSTTYLSIWL